MKALGLKLDSSEDTDKALGSLSWIIGVIIVLAVAAFGDVMYVIEMQRIFEGQGLLLIFCYVGAFTSFAAIGYLLLGKARVFRPGAQMLAAWILTGVELVIIALNIILVFNTSHTGFLAVWAQLSPATPVFHMCGVFLVLFLDPNLQAVHHEKELAAKEEKAELDLEHLVAMTRISVKRKQLAHIERQLAQISDSPQAIASAQKIAIAQYAQIFTQLTGSPMTSSVSSGKVVDSLPTGKKKEARELKQTAELPEIEETFDDEEDSEGEAEHAENSEIEPVKEESTQEASSPPEQPITQKKKAKQREMRRREANMIHHSW